MFASGRHPHWNSIFGICWTINCLFMCFCNSLILAISLNSPFLKFKKKLSPHSFKLPTTSPIIFYFRAFGNWGDPYLGSFSLFDDDRENVTIKVNSHFFKFFRVYSKLLKMSNVGECPRVGFLGKILSRAVTAKKCTKKHDARAKLFSFA